MTSIFGIIFTFIILGSVLLFNLIYTNINWFIKFLSITVTIYFSIITFLSLEDLKGWPIESVLPRSFMLIAVNVQEPTKKDGNGAIFLWCKDTTEHSIENNIMFNFLKPFFDLKTINQKPRNYELKYDKKLHEKLSEIEDMIKQGKAIVGEGKVKQKSDREMNGKEKELDSNHLNYDIKFYELPPPKMPEK